MRTTKYLLALCALLAAPGAWAQQADTLVAYEGKLQGAEGKPVGGVFALSFSLHDSPKGGRSLWTESHFVAVDEGEYVVELGDKRPLPPDLDLQRTYLAVSITGGGEIVRERVDPGSVKETGAAPSADGEGGAQPGAGGVVDYAETAGLAYEADHAKVADRVGNLTEEALLEKLKDSGGRGKLGNQRRLSAQAGGEGGAAYEVNCPKDHVVTGVRGGSGIYLDSIQLICQPLE